MEAASPGSRLSRSSAAWASGTSSMPEQGPDLLACRQALQVVVERRQLLTLEEFADDLPGLLVHRLTLTKKTPVATPGSELRQGFWIRCLAVTYSHMGKPHTTIGAEQFHFRVRNGIGWFPLAIAARQTFKTCRHPLCGAPTTMKMCLTSIASPGGVRQRLQSTNSS
jgi:hypothetical protein